jgi:hypothetical protein
VVRVDATSCAGGGIGTGFLIKGDLIATVAHVVNGATNIALTTGSSTVIADVIGEDTEQDVALLRPRSSLAGHVFTFAANPPAVGEPVAAIGFPLGLPITFTEGVVSGVHRSYPDQRITQTDLVQTDTPVSHGNSGGPLIDQSGEIVGLVDLAGPKGSNGISYAVSAQTATSRIEPWRASPHLVSAPLCQDPVGPGVAPVQPPTVTDGEAIANTLSAYFRAINARHFLTAWEQLTPAQQQRVTVEHLATQDATSFAFGFTVQSARYLDPNTVVVGLSFTSIQDPSKGPDGEGCTDWSLAYTMRRVGGAWLIDYVILIGPGHTPC